MNVALPDAYIKTEHLDSKNYSGVEYDKKLVDVLRYKYRANHFDLIVVSDDYAFNLVEKHYDELFSQIPVVFCGTNDFDIKRLEGKKGFVGVDEKPSFKETIELIKKLRPEINRIIVIHDDSLVGQINSKKFRTEAAGFTQKLEFKYLAGLKLEDLLEYIKTLSSDTVAFYFASFVKDRVGKSYSSVDALKILSSQSPVPFWGGWNFNLGHGIIGGKLINLFEHGALAGRLAVQILNGQNPASLREYQAELKKTLGEIKTLRGILPICSYCKQIRSDKGCWEKIESYIHEHSDAEFSHGICPECAKKYYPDMDLYGDEQTQR